MTVEDLIKAIENFLEEDKKGRYLNHVFINDGYEIDNYTIDSVYYRCGEVVGNEIGILVIYAIRIVKKMYLCISLIHFSLLSWRSASGAPTRCRISVSDSRRRKKAP